MLYPSTDVSCQSSEILEAVLEQVQLGYVSARTGGLDTTRDWQDELSLGEQQVGKASVGVAVRGWCRGHGLE